MTARSENIAPPRKNLPSDQAITRYGEVVSSAEVRNIRLIKSEFSFEAEGVSRDQSKWRMTYACDVIETKFDATRSLLTALVAGEVVCKLGRKHIVSFRAKYIVAYDLTGEVHEAAAAQFARRVGRFAAYPYFRTLFADLTAQAGLNLAPLPVLKEGRRSLPGQTNAAEG